MPLILCQTKGLTYPQFKCDYCAQYITNIGDGSLLVWDDDAAKPAQEFNPTIVCHDCEPKVDYRKTPYSMELDTAFVCLQGRSFPNHAAYQSAVEKTKLLNEIR
jgi:hypothetical protein